MIIEPKETSHQESSFNTRIPVYTRCTPMKSITSSGETRTQNPFTNSTANQITTTSSAKTTTQDTYTNSTANQLTTSTPFNITTNLGKLWVRTFSVYLEEFLFG